MSTSEADRKNILRQMKVRTTYKKDKSWIHQQNSEDEREENQISPQRKSFDGNKFLWSPTPDSKTERNSGTFTAREVITSSSPPMHSSNRHFSYSPNETNKSSSTTSQASPPQSTTGAKVTPSYIIRGQPFNAVSQVKNPPSFNGYQKSYSSIQPRTSTSLPRVPNATGHKMSTEEYKKLAPYNVRSRSADFSDDEVEEQPIDTEQTNRIMKSTPQRDRSYVLSAAKRTNGSSPQEAPSPLIAKKVQIQEEETSPNQKSQTLPKTLSSYLYDDHKKVPIQEEETSPNQKSQTLPKTLSSYLYDDHKKIENNLKETPSKETTSQTSSRTNSQTAPSGTITDGSSGLQLTSYSTSNVVESKSSAIKPGPARITVVRDERSNNDENVSKPSGERQLATSPMTTRKERVEITKKSDALPESLASYLYDDATRLEKNWKTNQATKSTSQTVSTSINNEKTVSRPVAEIQPPTSPMTTRKESNNSEKYVSKPTAEVQLSTSPMTTRKERVETTKKSDTLPESLASYLYDDVHRYERGWKSSQPTQSTSQTVTTRETDNPDSLKLTSWSHNTDSKIATIKPDPGKITVFRGERETNDLSIPRLTSSNAETKSPIINSEPGRITVFTEESYDTSPKASVQSSSTANTAESYDTYKDLPKASVQSSSTTRTTESYDTYKDLPKASVQSSSTTRTTESSKNAPDTLKLTSTSLASNVSDSTQSWAQTGPGKVTILEDKSPIDDSKVTSKSSEITSTTTYPKITIETLTDSTAPKAAPRMETKPKEAAPVKASYNQQDLISWSDLDNNTKTRPSQPTKSGVITTEEETRDNKARYRVTESLDDPEFNVINNQSASGSKRVTIVETPSERPRTPEPRSSSPRPTPRPRESIKTAVTESRYRVPDTLEDTMLEASPSRSGSRTTVTTTRSADPVYTEYMEGPDSRSTRTVSSSRETITTTTEERRQGQSSYAEASQYDPQASNKGVLFLKEYVNSRESLKSPSSTGSVPDFSDDSERLSYSTSSSYLYSSPPERSDEGPCSYCGRPIKDCPKIILEHLNIHCHEYCFKCGICNKPMGDLVDSLFIHRDVVHCESCYEKLF
ncbi:zinc finger protein 185 isoform X3 [Hyla sarda]|uniref:zinc finger protein 185 isoform X3 n=1 Tax=Hyla sarda TaxID=327740 RepID=UPI0024C37A8D|nr:zinc finger protein 185 isoform X3 [Hyla sarda]